MRDQRLLHELRVRHYDRAWIELREEGLLALGTRSEIALRQIVPGRDRHIVDEHELGARHDEIMIDDEPATTLQSLYRGGSVATRANAGSEPELEPPPLASDDGGHASRLEPAPLHAQKLPCATAQIEASTIEQHVHGGGNRLPAARERLIDHVQHVADVRREIGSAQHVRAGGTAH